MQNDPLNEPGGTRESERTVAAVSAALALLDCFEEDVSLKLRDLHQRTGMQKSRIMRLAGSLAASGYLIIDPDGGGYRLGPRIRALGHVVASGSAGLLDRIRPLLTRLSMQFGDTCFFSVVRGTQRVVLEQVSPEQGLRFIVREGQMRPLHAGATGKILLAFGPRALRDRIVHGALPSLTESTTVDSATLAAELDDAHARGFCVSRGEATQHSYALAVPVLDEHRALLGAVSIAGPSSKLPHDQEFPLADDLRRAITEIGLFTGGPPLTGESDDGRTEYRG